MEVDEVGEDDYLLRQSNKLRRKERIMATAYCIDISGSVPRESIQSAFDFVSKGLEPNDCIIVFDGLAKIVDKEYKYKPGDCFAFRGSDCRKAFELAKQQGCYSTILISDGYLMEKDVAIFNKFFHIENLGKR